MQKSNTRNEFWDVDAVLDVPVSSFVGIAGHFFFSVSGGEKFVEARLTLGADNVQDITGDEGINSVPPADVIIHPVVLICCTEI